MLDVYRDFYGLTGEPFRLGPDYRFSLHHKSYANAKAYLEYAIYQGEGFIAITGAPGTGKTTLISEILAGLDTEKVRVATLNSTRLESRDLLYMVASAFDLHPKDVSKANLLIEIESSLVHKIRTGQRAILIVDEAQGLSTAALEELRLLANLQYQYQLLLQIFLVGQERLLKMVGAPGMEHLQQRLVAATSLEPLDFSETVDYVEHRLSRVGWESDPAIDAGALREIYRYSGGVPRRINLITNRLFLYGGMEQKHGFGAGDARNVIQDLINEFLLAPEPQLNEAAVAAIVNTADKARSYNLPRKRQTPPPPGEPVKPTNGRTSKARAAGKSNRSAGNPAKPANERACKARASKSNRPAVSEPAPPTAMERPVPPRGPHRVRPKTGKKGGGFKGFVMALMTLVLAGAAYLLPEETGNQDQWHRTVEPSSTTEGLKTASSPGKETEPVTAVPTVENTQTGDVGTAAPVSREDPPPVQKAVGEGKVIRTPSSESTGIVDGAEPVPDEVPLTAVEKAGPVARVSHDAVSQVPVQPAVAVAETPGPVPSGQSTLVVKPEPVVSDLVPLPEAAAASTDMVEKSPGVEAIKAQRERLRQAAERRFSVRQTLAQTKAVAFVPVPGKQAVTVPGQAAVGKKKALFNPGEIVTLLLDGHWSSRGKPASLLPSETTFCQKKTDEIRCHSVPKNIKTQYGLALYKVEITLNAFSRQGHFEMLYRTLVKLVDAGATIRDEGPAASGNGGWQVSAHAMSCILSNTGQVTCKDSKGVSREYRRMLPGSRPAP